MISEFALGPWLPDVTDYRNPGLEVCTNVIPGPGGYKPAYGANTSEGDVGAAVLSAMSFQRADGTRITVCATAGDLHHIVGGTVADSTLTLTLTEPVRFERFGSSIYASSKEGVWYLDDIEADSTFVAENWTIPHGLAMARVGDFLFMGNLIDTDTNDASYRVRWSPYNNPQGEWATSISLQSDAVDMPENLGVVMGITGGNTGLIFQRNGLSRIQYTGGPSVFAKQVVDTQRGLAAPFSLAQVGENVFYLSDDGFFVTNGTAGQSISRGRVWDWFLANASQTYLSTVQAAVDWPNRCVVWTVPGDSGAFVGLLYYNWETQWWSYVALATDCVFASGIAGLTLEQVAAIYTDLDTMTLSLDSPSFAARGKSMAAFVGGIQYQLTGSSLAAVFESGEFQPQPGKRVFVRSVTPIVTDSSDATLVTMTGRVRAGASYTSAPDVAIGPIGFAPFNFDSRFVRVGLTIPAGTTWNDAFGYQIDFDVSGDT